MKKINSTILLRSVLALAVVVFVLGIFFAVTREKKKNDIYILKEPDLIQVEENDKVYIIHKDTDAYKKLHEEIKRCWDDSLHKGKLEFVLWNRASEPIKTEVKINYYYHDPIKWSM